MGDPGLRRGRASRRSCARRPSVAGRRGRARSCSSAARCRSATSAIGDRSPSRPQRRRGRTLRVVGFVHDINAVPAQFTGRGRPASSSMETLDALDEPRRAQHAGACCLAQRVYTRGEASRIAADIRDTELARRRRAHVVRTDVPEPGSHFLGDIFKAVSLLLLALGVLSLGALGLPCGDDGLGDHGAAGRADRHHEGGRWHDALQIVVDVPRDGCGLRRAGGRRRAAGRLARRRRGSPTTPPAC